MTLKDAAQTAIDIQDTCNLSGVLYTWAEVRDAVNAACDSTAARNRHPIHVLFASKCADLTGAGMTDLDTFGAAFHACQTIVEEG